MTCGIYISTGIRKIRPNAYRAPRPKLSVRLPFCSKNLTHEICQPPTLSIKTLSYNVPFGTQWLVIFIQFLSNATCYDPWQSAAQEANCFSWWGHLKKTTTTWVIFFSSLSCITIPEWDTGAPKGLILNFFIKVSPWGARSAVLNTNP